MFVKIVEVLLGSEKDETMGSASDEIYWETYPESENSLVLN